MNYVCIISPVVWSGLIWSGLVRGSVRCGWMATMSCCYSSFSSTSTSTSTISIATKPGAILCCRAEKTDQQQLQQQQQLLQSQQSSSVKKQQRRERWQWSKGDGPGEYGGPPLDFKIRQFAWKERGVDPITSRADYIWNKEWQSHLRSTPPLSSLSSSEEEKEVKKGNSTYPSWVHFLQTYMAIYIRERWCI